MKKTYIDMKGGKLELTDAEFHSYPFNSRLTLIKEEEVKTKPKRIIRTKIMESD